MNRLRFQAGGPIRNDARAIYIKRDCDRFVLSELLSGQYVHLAESRQQGKTSMLLRLREDLHETNSRVLYLDMARLPLRDEGSFYKHLLSALDRQWKLAFQFPCPGLSGLEAQSRGWDNALVSMEECLREQNMRAIIALDEVRLPTFPEGEEFFVRIRSETTEYMRCIDFVLAGVFATGELITGSWSPFNVGERVRLEDFELEQVQELLKQGQLDGSMAEEIFEWSDGHPFLTQCVCVELASNLARNNPVAVAVQQVRRNQVEHFRHIIKRVRSETPRIETVKRLFNHGPQPTVDLLVQSELELLGIIKCTAAGWRIRNNAYKEVLQQLFEGLDTTHACIRESPSTQRLRKKVFISYARKDQKYLRQVSELLKAAWLQRGIAPWADPELIPGIEYIPELDDIISQAAAAILLVSSRFLVSEFIDNEELPRIESRYSKGMPVLPLVLEPCAWDEHPFIRKLQVHPPDGKTFSGLRGCEAKARSIQEFAQQVASRVESGIGSTK